MLWFSVDSPVLVVLEHENACAKLGNLKIQDILKEEGGLKCINGMD
jgi:hypothetical protein